MYITKINSVNNTYFKQRYNGNPINPSFEQEPRYNVSHKFSALNSGNADYNSKTGDYDVTTKGFLHIIKRRELYYPNKETEVIIRRTSEGIKKVTKTPTETITQMFDKSAVLKEDKDFSIIDEGDLDYKNGEFLRLRETSLGSKYLLRYDKVLGRKIKITQTEEGRDAKIYDVKAHKYVTSGPLIYDTYENDEGEEITENLLTGNILQRTQYRYKSKDIKKQIKYYENSSNPRYIYNYCNSTGQSTEKYMDQSGNTTRLEINNPQDKSKEIYTYDGEGNILIHKEVIFGFSLTSKKPVIREITYNPNNDDIVRVVENKIGNTIITQYSSTEKTGENVPDTISYLKDKKLNVFERLQNDGEDVLSRIEFNQLREACYSVYNKDRNIKSINYFDKKGNLEASLDFVKGTKRLSSFTKYKPNNGGYVQYVYSKYSKSPVSIIKVDENNQIQKITLNLDEKTAPKNLLSSYFEDGRYDMAWHSKSVVEGLKYPSLPKTRDEALCLSEELDKKVVEAYKTRENNLTITD